MRFEPWGDKILRCPPMASFVKYRFFVPPEGELFWLHVGGHFIFCPPRGHHQMKSHPATFTLIRLTSNRCRSKALFELFRSAPVSLKSEPCEDGKPVIKYTIRNAISHRGSKNLSDFSGGTFTKMYPPNIVGGTMKNFVPQRNPKFRTAYKFISSSRQMRISKHQP